MKLVAQWCRSLRISQREGPRFESSSPPRGACWLYCAEFACSRHVCLGSLRVFRLRPTVQRHAFGGTDKLAALKSTLRCESEC